VTEPIINTTGGVPQLELNPYRWSSIANVVFLEAPAGVGFSYADTDAGTHHNDTSTAADNFAAVAMFLKGFPELASNDFYVAGESYAGAYVPMLALQILEHNKKAELDGKSTINLKGILVGNGVTGAGSIPGDVSEKLHTDFYYGHGLFSATLYAKIQASCGDYKTPSKDCQNDLDEMHQVIGHVNVYDLYMPCIMAMDERGVNQQDSSMIRAESTSPSLQRAMANRLGGPDGCIDAGAATKYLDNAIVQKALHVSVAKKAWHICGGIQYTSDSGSLLPYYKETLIPEIKVLIFNGDVDACVPYVGNEWWTSSLGLPVVKPWRSWTVDTQVAGYVTSYVSDEEFKTKGLTFLTVKGSGHMVPQFRPKQAFAMFQRFTTSTPFDCENGGSCPSHDEL
jgi:serine carboxypeptidase-like clade 1